MASLQLFQEAYLAMNENTSSLKNATSAPYAEWAKTAVNRSLVGIMCSLSILGSVTIMASYAFWEDIRTTSRKILLYLSISDLVIAISNLFGVLIPIDDNLTNPQNLQCVIQSFITTSASITSFLWTASLAIYLYIAIVKNKQAFGKKLMLWFHLVNWTLGPIINTIAVSYKALGYAADPITGGWCWIYHDTTLDTKTQFIISTKEKFWITVDGKGIEIFVYTTIFVIYGLIKCRLGNELKQQLKRSQKPIQPDVLKSAKSADRKLIFVPLLLFFGRFWGILKFFMTMFSHPTKTITLKTFDKALLTLEGIGDSSQGFLNCVLFCFLNPKVYQHIKEGILYCACCHGKNPGIEDAPYHETDGGSLNGDNNQTSVSIPHPSEEDRQPLLEGGVKVNKYGSQWKKK